MSKEAFIKFGKGFIEGAAVGGTSAVILRKYDGLIQYLPKPVRYAVDGILGAGLLWTGLKAVDAIHSVLGDD